MTTGSQYLFIYGTLLDNSNPFGAYLHANSRPVGPGSFPGRLYNIGHYPGAIFDEACGLQVHGQIVELFHPDEILSKLDLYEGIGPDEQEPHEYVRKIVTIITNEDQLSCWVYLYNHPVHSYPEIRSGRYKL